MPKLFEDSGFTFRFYAADLDEPIHMPVEVIKLPYPVPYTDTVTELTIPVAIPDLDQVREFAYELHSKSQPWHGEYQGWPSYYTPEDRSRKPPNSRQEFYPAEFWIGTDHIWTFTMAWEDGAEQEPLESESKYSKHILVH